MARWESDRCSNRSFRFVVRISEEGDRQDIENWISIYDRISEGCGGDAALIFNRLRELSNLEKDGPKSSSSGTGGAVQIMTIHGSKGLEAPVVVAYDIFATGTRDSSFSSSDNVLVTLTSSQAEYILGVA